MMFGFRDFVFKNGTFVIFCFDDYGNFLLNVGVFLGF